MLATKAWFFLSQELPLPLCPMGTVFPGALFFFFFSVKLHASGCTDANHALHLWSSPHPPPLRIPGIWVGIPLLMVYNDTEDHSSSALYVSPLALWILSATFGFKTDHFSSPSDFPKVSKEGRGCPRL